MAKKGEQWFRHLDEIINVIFTPLQEKRFDSWYEHNHPAFEQIIEYLEANTIDFTFKRIK